MRARRRLLASFILLYPPCSFNHLQVAGGKQAKSGVTNRGLPSPLVTVGPLTEDGKPNLENLGQHLVAFSYIGGRCLWKSTIFSRMFIRRIFKEAKSPSSHHCTLGSIERFSSVNPILSSAEPRWRLPAEE